jgi:two-component system phosphate regulon sensor histidine kinase PhoR
MSPQRITYLVALCLLLIFATQAYLVVDHFLNIRESLTRESNAIIEDAFRKDLSDRNTFYKHLTGEDTLTTPPPATNGNTAALDMKYVKEYKDNLPGLLDLMMNKFVSKTVPMNIRKLDSITGSILQSRNIHSKFRVNIVDMKTGKVLDHSEKASGSSIFVVPSKLFQIDLEKQKSLQLILVNPFSLIIQRMGLMLIISFVLSILCLLAFRLLLRILARQKQLVTFKNDFLTTIAHELKRPVASLSFNLDCLTLPAFFENAEKRELLVDKSINATLELNDSINMIVALSRVEEGLLKLNKEPVNLQELFDVLKTRFVNYPAKKVEIQTVYMISEASVYGDVRLLSQCFANLIDNAIKYSSNQVLIIITIQRSAQWVTVSVKDNGDGIPEEKLPVIFEKYTRVHPENKTVNGFGIGLNYVKTIVEEHNGEVNVRSHPGIGSEFCVSLPG